MGKLEELIKEFCPNGVEYISVEELLKEKTIASITPSLKIKRNDYKDFGEIAIISQEEEYISGYCNILDKKIIDGQYVCFGDHTENVKYVDFRFVQGADGLKIICCNNKEKIDIKYFYYAVCNFYKRHNNYERHYKYFVELQIPLPALPVQREIVRILDSFTLYSAELTAELTAELIARRKQYEFYRDKLLDFNQQKIEVRKLFEIFEIRNGYTPSKKNKENWINGTIPWFRLEDIRENGRELDDSIQHITSIGVKKSGLFKKGSIILSTTATIGEHAIINRDFLCNQQLTVLTINAEYKDRLMEKFVFYYCYIVGKNCISVCNYSGGIPIIDSGKFKNLLFPVPPMDVQERIVKVLDNFDAICSDLGIGLPAEIEKRQKQYEYYRDKLLTFEEKNNNGEK